MEELFVLFAGAFMVIMIFSVIWYVLQVIAYWKMFTKAGEAGWKSLIPIYNVYVQFKISWNTTMFWIMLCFALSATLLYAFGGLFAVIGWVVSLCASVITFISMYKLAQSFGYGIGFTIGLIFFTPIFTMILGFGDARYVGPAM